MTTEGGVQHITQAPRQKQGASAETQPLTRGKPPPTLLFRAAGTSTELGF